MPEWMRKWAKSDVRNGIAVLYILAILLFLFVLAARPVPTENKDLVNIAVGSALTGLQVILSYFYGSSKTDQKKEDDANG